MIYKCKCHVCGKEWDLETHFLSTPLILIGEDDEERCGLQCGAHTGAEVRAAYNEIVRKSR